MRFPKRKTNNRSLKEPKEIEQLELAKSLSSLEIVLSFKDIDNSQIPPGHSFKEAIQSGKLKNIFDIFKQICGLTGPSALKEDILELYGSFLENSAFKYPSYIKPNVNWGVIRKIGGQKGRIAGYLENNVFHVVFLDLDHKFYPSTKKNT